MWRFVDPVGDSTLSMTGSQVQIDLSPANAHDSWSGFDTAPRLVQSAVDTDFDVQVRFDSPLTTDFQSQGLLVRHDDSDFLRIELRKKRNKTRLFVASIEPDSADVLRDRTVYVDVPMWLAVGRVGD